MVAVAVAVAVAGVAVVVVVVAVAGVAPNGVVIYTYTIREIKMTRL